MNLYHFTTPENALLIGMGAGLTPGIHKEGTAHSAEMMTMGQPVVWLTQEETNLAKAADVAHWAEAIEDWEARGIEGGKNKKTGEPRYGGPVRCQVFIERHNRKLMRWPDFMRTTTLIGTIPTTRTSK